MRCPVTDTAPQRQLRDMSGFVNYKEL